MDDTDKTTEGTISVLAPESTFEATQGKAKSCFNDSTKGERITLGAGGTLGMEFTATVNDSNLPDDLQGGKFALLQLVDWDRQISASATVNGAIKLYGETVRPKNGKYSDEGYILDTAFPLSKPVGGGDAEVSVGPNSSTWRDTPGITLGNITLLGNDFSHPKTAELHDFFRTYLMFKPEGSDSKWVPVKKITWSFYGKAVKSSRGWKAADDPDPAYESKQETQECHDHPLWKASTEDESDDYYPCQ